jgi:hypothetical protein
MKNIILEFPDPQLRFNGSNSGSSSQSFDDNL